MAFVDEIWALLGWKPLKYLVIFLLLYTFLGGMFWGALNETFIDLGIAKPTPAPTIAPQPTISPTVKPTYKPTISPTVRPTEIPSAFDYTGGVVDQYGNYYPGFGYKNVITGSTWKVNGTLIYPWGITNY